ncbi:hypothetical protein HF086_011021 [Spodoptera exigua]|uniref:Uncharacterized protein n=1 Tax=Spodoptera exigua TaxID=7107 RepID=A0A922SMI0_SPOEX|nr:hypothetical protein HF086_011021 [Spodoptera exigua]
MAIQFPSHNIMRRPHARGGRFNTPTRFTRGGIATKMFSVNQSVDHRPRALLISGFEADELDALVAHFSVISKEVELSVPQLVLQYKSRQHAEHAAANGKHYNDRTLSQPPVDLPEDTLLRFDEEEEDDADEDRSWRR